MADTKIIIIKDIILQNSRILLVSITPCLAFRHDAEGIRESKRSCNLFGPLLFGTLCTGYETEETVNPFSELIQIESITKALFFLSKFLRWQFRKLSVSATWKVFFFHSFQTFNLTCRSVTYMTSQ